MKNFCVIEFIDDSVGSMIFHGRYKTFEEAKECILNEYFNGDQDEMDDYDEDENIHPYRWMNNCNGCIIFPKGDESGVYEKTKHFKKGQYFDLSNIGE